MKFMLVLLILGDGGRPVFVPVGTLATEADCETAGAAIVARTNAASAPATADWFCETVAGPLS